MQSREPEVRRHRSPFVAAFLSFVFPGLGQAYAGFAGRGLGFAAPIVLLVALLGGTLTNRFTRDWLISELASPTVLLLILVANLALLLYRLLAVVDAFRVAAALETARSQAAVARAGLRPKGARIQYRPAATLGLLAILLVTPIAHIGLARYDLTAYDLITTITSGSGPAIPTPSPRPSAAGPSGSPAGSPTPTPTAAAPPAWTGTGRLNILLVGADQRPAQSTFNTDTMIVVSIDPTTKQVAMLSLPRDMSDVPLPASWPAHAYYANGVFPGKITTLWTAAAGSPGLFPFPGNAVQRGFNALKGILGNLYQLNIQYYVEVNFQGFRTVVDTLGGITVNVQVPVVDTHYPVSDTQALNLYIPAGIQHMNGSEALAYARSRHASSDFDRAARQQRVVVSVREQTDPATLLANLDRLVAVLKSSVHTDIPAELFPSLIRLAEQVDTHSIRQLVFTPPVFGTECNNPSASCYYSLYPNVDAIRLAVRQMFRSNPALDASRTKLASEAAQVAVLNGSGQNGQASSVAAYLQYLGMDASVGLANGGRAARQTYRQTVVTVYNGAAARLPETIRVLQQTFGVTVVEETDPTVKVDVIVITGSQTPRLIVPS